MTVLETLKSFAIAAFTVKARPANPVERHYTNCDPTRPKTELAKKATGALVGEAIAKCQLEEATGSLMDVTNEVVHRAVEARRQKQVQEQIQILGGR